MFKDRRVPPSRSAGLSRLSRIPDRLLAISVITIRTVPAWRWFSHPHCIPTVSRAYSGWIVDQFGKAGIEPASRILLSLSAPRALPLSYFPRNQNPFYLLISEFFSSFKLEKTRINEKLIFCSLPPPLMRNILRHKRLLIFLRKSGLPVAYPSIPGGMVYRAFNDFPSFRNSLEYWIFTIPHVLVLHPIHNGLCCPAARLVVEIETAFRSRLMRKKGAL